MIVASVGKWPIAAGEAALERIDAIELRLDLMGAALADLPAIAREVTARVPCFLATCRSSQTSDRDRVALLCEAIRLGAWAVDIEIDAPPASRAAVIAAARSNGCSVIVSHHDHERTPVRAALTRIVRRSIAAGADIVKIACRVRTPADNAALLGLLGEDATAGRVAVIGMGPLGWVTRVVAPLLGSPLTFVSLGSGTETAPGQPTRDELLAAWSALGAGS